MLLWSVIAILSILARASRPLVNNTNFTYWCEGKCGTEIIASDANPEGGLILMGGGTDTDEAFRQLIKWSDSGNILIIRAYGVWALIDMETFVVDQLHILRL